MDPELTAFKTMFDYKLEPEVYNFHLLDALIKAAEKEGITNFPIHIKLDTGMHRLGFGIDEIPLLIRRLKAQNAVIARSVFSHFVGSDSPQFDYQNGCCSCVPTGYIRLRFPTIPAPALY